MAALGKHAERCSRERLPVKKVTPEAPDPVYTRLPLLWTTSKSSQPSSGLKGPELQRDRQTEAGLQPQRPCVAKGNMGEAAAPMDDDDGNKIPIKRTGDRGGDGRVTMHRESVALARVTTHDGRNGFTDFTIELHHRAEHLAGGSARHFPRSVTVDTVPPARV